MIKLLREKRKIYLDKIIAELDQYLYRCKRYNFEFSLALGLSDERVNLENFTHKKRKTDAFIHLEDNLYCIVLDGTNSDSAIKATSNLQTLFQRTYFDVKLYVSVVTSTEYNSEYVMVNSLFDILEYSINHNMDNQVMDKDQITQKH